MLNSALMSEQDGNSKLMEVVPSAPVINRFLDFLDKEMTIMGILSAFFVAVVSVFLNAVGSADLAKNKETLFSDLWSQEHWYILVGSGWILGAAGLFYAQRNMLAWYYGQITPTMEDPKTPKKQIESVDPIQVSMEKANKELAWIPNRAAFRCLWLGLAAYAFAFLELAMKPHRHFGWLDIILSVVIVLFTLWQVRPEDKPRKTFFKRHEEKLLTWGRNARRQSISA
jgi:hypothetical protein